MKDVMIEPVSKAFNKDKFFEFFDKIKLNEFQKND